MLKNKFTVLKNGARSIATKSFEDIPGPPGNGLPFIGHSHLYLKKPHGFARSWNNVKSLTEKYLKDDDKLMRLNIPYLTGSLSPSGDRFSW